MRIVQFRLEALVVVALLVGAGGCRRLSDDDAVALVRAYDRRLVEAYATGNPQLMEEVAGPEEARKVLGLIGVKADMGLALHARMDELVVGGVERADGALVVRTRERWSYEDRSTTTGQRVGAESSDSYDIRYHLAQVDGRWVVVRVEFASPPSVGRSSAPVTAPPDVFHGAMPGGEGAGPASPGGKR